MIKSKDIGIYEIEEQAFFSIYQRISGIIILVFFSILSIISGSKFFIYFFSFYDFYNFYIFVFEEEIHDIFFYFILFGIIFITFHCLHALFRYTWLQKFWYYSPIIYFYKTHIIFYVFYHDDEYEANESYERNSTETLMFSAASGVYSSLMIFL